MLSTKAQQAKFSAWIKEQFRQWFDNQLETEGVVRRQADFARFLGVTPASLSSWIQGSRLPVGDSVTVLEKTYPEIHEVLGLKKDPSQARVDSAWDRLSLGARDEILAIVAREERVNERASVEVRSSDRP